MIVPQTVNEKLPRDILLGVAATTLIFVISVYLPVIGFFFSLLVPLPILFYRIKLGRGAGGIIPVVTFLVMISMMDSFSPDTLFFSGLIVSGFALGEFLERDLSVEKTVLYSSGVVLFTGLAGLFLYSGFHNKGPVRLVTEYVEESIRLVIITWESMDAPKENIDLISTYLTQRVPILVRIIPAIMVISALFETWVIMLIVRPLLRRMNLSTNDFGALNRWKSPDLLVWAVIACGGMLLVPSDMAWILGLNGLIILMMIYFFQGIAILSFYFEKKQFPKMLRFLIYGMVIFQQIFLLLIVILGLFDVWFDFRRMEPKKET